MGYILFHGLEKGALLKYNIILQPIVGVYHFYMKIDDCHCHSQLVIALLDDSHLDEKG